MDGDGAYEDPSRKKFDRYIHLHLHIHIGVTFPAVHAFNVRWPGQGLRKEGIVVVPY